MFCCACASRCNHVGPHSFCPAHGGSPYTGQVVTGANIVPSAEMEAYARGYQDGFAAAQRARFAAPTPEEGSER